MHYYSPFNIFSENQITSLSREKLSAAQDQFGAYLSSQPNNAVKIKGKKVDIQEAGMIFEELKKNYDLHLVIYRNSSLLSFLETGSLDFFNDEFAINSVKNDAANNEEIDDLIAKMLNHQLPKQLDLLETSSHTKLSSIYAYTSGMESRTIDTAYSGTRDSIKRYIDYLNKSYKTPFSSSVAKVYDPKVSLQVSDVFYSFFDVLPQNFEPLKKAYAQWCNNMVVRPTLRRDNGYTSLEAGSKMTLAKAANIAGDYYDIHENKEIVQDIQQAKNITKGTQKSSWVKPIAILGALIGLIAIGYKGYKAGSGRSDTEIIAKDTTPKKKKLDLKAIATRYSGEDWDIVNPVQTNIEDNKNETTIYFDVDVLPTTSEGLDFLIPMEQIDKYKNINRVYNLEFSPRGSSAPVVRHRLDIEFSDISNESFINYDKREDVKDEKNTITVKSIRSTDFPMVGKISRQSTSDNSITSTEAFTVDFDTETMEYTVIPEAGQPILIRKDDILEGVNNEELDDATKKYKFLINALYLVRNKYLKERNFYTLSSVPMYSISNQKGELAKVYDDKGYLKYSYTSGIDDTAFVLLKGKDFYINYYVAHEKGKIRATQMTNVSADGRSVERVLLYSKNE